MSDGYKKSLETKQKIITSTIEMLKTTDYEAITIRNICKSSGVSLSRINYHFKSKENLFLEISKLLPQCLHNEINRRHPNYNNPKRMEGDLAFTILLIRMLLSTYPPMDTYRKIYCSSFVTEHIIESSLTGFLDLRKILNSDMSRELVQIYACAYANSIVSLVKPGTFEIMRRNVNKTIDALCEFYMILLNVQGDKKTAVIKGAFDLVKDIDFEVIGLDEIKFY